jgi:hypothetical protein
MDFKECFLMERKCKSFMLLSAKPGYWSMSTGGAKTNGLNPWQRGYINHKQTTFLMNQEN